MGLLNGINGIALCLKGVHGVFRIGIILPIDTLFGTQRGLVYLLIRRTTADAAEHHARYTHRIGGTKNSTYIVLTAYIIEYHHQR